MNFTGEVQITGAQSQDYGTTQLHPLGAIARTKDGRAFRYANAGAVALTVGDFIQSSADVANHKTLTSAAAAIGATSVTMTLGNTAATANQYAEGYLMAAVTPGMGRTYGIIGHPAADADATLAVTLDASDPIVIALTTASRLHLIANPYKDVIQFPVTTATGVCVGVAVSAIPIANFGWLQTKGPCCPLTDGTPALGAHVMVPGAVAGAAEIVVAAGTLIVAQFVGRMIFAGVDNVRNPVMLDID